MAERDSAAYHAAPPRNHKATWSDLRQLEGPAPHRGHLFELDCESASKWDPVAELSQNIEATEETSVHLGSRWAPIRTPPPSRIEALIQRLGSILTGSRFTCISWLRARRTVDGARAALRMARLAHPSAPGASLALGCGGRSSRGSSGRSSLPRSGSRRSRLRGVG